MRFHWLFLAIWLLPGCGRDWSLPSPGYTGQCSSDEDCPNGLCTNKLCQLFCNTDADCLDGHQCIEDIMRGGYQCVPKIEVEGPALLGDPHALTMLDNLESAFDFVRERHPGADLTTITAGTVHGDGSVDLRDVSSSWVYLFQSEVEGDGTVSVIYVSYMPAIGEEQGIYSVANGAQPSPVMPEQDWRQFLNSPELVAAYALEPDCNALTGTSGDTFACRLDTDVLQFVIQNPDGNLVVGDPQTGEITYASCYP